MGTNSYITHYLSLETHIRVFLMIFCHPIPFRMRKTTQSVRNRLVMWQTTRSYVPQDWPLHCLQNCKTVSRFMSYSSSYETKTNFPLIFFNQQKGYKIFSLLSLCFVLAYFQLLLPHLSPSTVSSLSLSLLHHYYDNYIIFINK